MGKFQSMKIFPISQINRRPNFLAIMILIIFVGMIPTQTKAQFDAESWTLPVNLSQSGLSTNPVMVIDSAGTTHVFWLDLLEGVVYANGSGEQWDAPLAVDPPFESDISEDSGNQEGGGLGRGSGGAESTAQDSFVESSYIMFAPSLVADQSGKLHAFWINAELELFYSNVIAENMATSDWSTAVRLAETVQDFEVFIDGSGGLHVAYVLGFNTTQYSSGVFYRVRNASSGDWSTPEGLYESPYFRAISPEQANVDIVAVPEDDSQLIYVAWDNRPRNTLNFTKSADGGLTWDGTQEVQGPGASLQAITPYDIQVVANEQDTILLWQEAESEVSCRQYYQVSKDGGQSWGPPQRLLENFPGCPQANNLMIGGDGLILLEQTRLDQVYFLAWDGVEWSSPQLQQAIANFVDPETLKPIDLQCHSSVLDEGNRLVLVGCDTNSQDIWLTSRSLETVPQWFPLPSNWSQPITVATSSTKLSSLSMVSDDEDRLHVVWNERATDLPTAGDSNSINYARWEIDRWVVSPDVLVPPVGKVRQVDIAIDSRERLFVVWSGGELGEIYYSWANASVANSISEWATPIALPSVPNVGSGPEILIDESGMIYVVFAVPLNEDRGIYLVKSTDAGNSWSGPIRIFSGVTAGWEMVGDPHWSRTSDGSLHLIWTHNSLPGGSGPMALYYTRSDDHGETWREPELVAEAAIMWSQIQGVGESSVHRIWQEIKNDLTLIWFQVSLDNGLTWSQPTNISGLGAHKGAAALTQDDMGWLHMLHLAEETSENLVLREWIWDGVNLNVGESLDLGSGRLSDAPAIAAEINSTGDLAVLISEFVGDSPDELTGEELIYTGRRLDSSEGVPIQVLQPTLEVQATLEPTPTLQASPTPSPNPVVTPSPTDRVVQVKNQPDRLGGMTRMNVGTILGIMIVGVLILLFVYFRAGSKLKVFSEIIGRWKH